MDRRRWVLRGVVQGVGFRPHVARVAARVPVTGFCGNDDESVFIEAQGAEADLEVLIETVVAQLPPIAVVTSVEEARVPIVVDEAGFRIVESTRADGAVTLIPPDIAPCDDCLREQADPLDRRFGHPFISCTNCGPRFSIIRDVPYDRPLTTMAAFPLCRACLAEYTDPLDRRYHAQPICCWDCGPSLALLDADGARHAGAAPTGDRRAGAEAALAAARAVLDAGGILAVKGVGGYAIMADARSSAAVARLRERKRRPGKPLAVMAADADAALAIARIGWLQRHELESPQRPIVLCAATADGGLADGIAPGLDEVGVLLPSSPLHRLLLRPGEVLVCTSGNRSGEPIAYRDEDALAALAGIADAFLTHDREIHVPVEDSVLIADGDDVAPIRRSRGFAPLPVPLPVSAGTVLAVGGELKNTFALTRDGMAFLSAHIGDMGSLATQLAFERSVDQMRAAHRSEPALVVADLHPGYATTAWAQRRCVDTGTPLLQVQHHHAHALSLLAEHGALGEPAVVAVLDGTGYGPDGTVWGGELLAIGRDATRFERVWHLPSFWLPGGDAAVRAPWRCAVALLSELGVDDAGLPCVAAAPAAELRLVRSQLTSGVAATRTTSAGRLFDAVASILGVRHEVSYEAQAAMELERCARGCAHEAHASASAPDVGELVRRIVGMVGAGADAACAARVFHAALAGIVAAALEAAAAEHGTTTVGCSGGVFQNRLLANELTRRLDGHRLRVLSHELVPANDGGLSLGQAAAGALALAAAGVTGEPIRRMEED